MKKVYPLIALALIIPIAALAQYQRHIIQLTDKNNSPYSISNPSAYLSAKAIARRTSQQIAIDATDLPVNPAYLDSIRSVPNVTILNVSKWLNQVLIRTADAAALAKINSFPFVKAAQEIAPRLHTGYMPPANQKFNTEKELMPVDASSRQQQLTGTEDLNYGSTFNQIHIHEGEYLHNLGFTGRNITIAMMDAGYNSYKTNPAFDSVRLQGRVLGEWDYVNNETSVNEDNFHGAGCFSIIAANRPGQIVGSAPHASFWLFRTEDVSSEYPVEEQNWAAAAEFADSAGADMISSSLGYLDFDNPVYDHSYAQRDGNTSIITRAADLAAQKGMIVMNSAGNNGNLNNENKYVSCPADGDSVVTVGSIDANGNIASSSSWGPNGAGKLKPNVVSVGQGAILANTAGTPAANNGTSFANPNMAGLIACLWQAFPEMTNMQIIDAVQKSAHQYNNPDERFGYGIPNFRKAYLYLLQQSAQAVPVINDDPCVISIAWQGKTTTGMTFLIERKLPAETGFKQIGSVQATNPLVPVTNYEYKDSLKVSLAGTIDYKIKLVVAEDTIADYITIQVPVSTPCINNFQTIALPNPFTDNLQLIINAENAISKLGIQISDVTGKVVFRKNTSKSTGYYSTSIYLPGLSPGVYILKLFDGGKGFYHQKLLKL